MNLYTETKHLLIKEFKREMREQNAFIGIMLFSLSSLFIIHICLSVRQIGKLPLPFWNCIFWITFLFSALHCTAKSFTHHGKSTLLYLYTIVHPVSIILSKSIFHCILLSFLSLLTFGMYIVFFGNPIQNTALFFLNLFLINIGIGFVLTLISAIASTTENSTVFTALLGLPILIPILIFAVKITYYALDNFDFSQAQDMFLSLCLLDVICITASILLFPYIWRD
ncbi:MAG: heme exporter protein CcmB [Chitinophagaceae bacterium]|nr:heme exporter protein CcmB [Chitinophagaceae bacterium]